MAMKSISENPILNAGPTSLVTGGLGGLGLLACHELVIAGRSRVMAVSRSGRPAPGQHSDAVVEAIQEVASLEGFRADISDSASLLDLASFACVMDVENKEYFKEKAANEEEIQRLIAKHGESLEPQIRRLAKIDYYTFFSGMIDVYGQALQAGVKLGPARLSKAKKFMDLLASKLHEMGAGSKTEDFTFIKMRFKEKLTEFQEIVGHLEDLETAASEDALPEAGQALGIPEKYVTGKKQALLGGEDSLLCTMEKEMIPMRTTVVSCPDGGHPLVLTALKGLWICDNCEGEFRTYKTQCFACKDCRFYLCGRCFNEARQALAVGAEHKAKEDRERKATEEAGMIKTAEVEDQANEEARRLEREEAEGKAREEAKRIAKDAAERKARADAERKEREEAERKAKEEAEKKAKQEARERAAAAACPLGHALEGFKVQAGFPCDACGAEAVDGGSLWGCRARDAAGRRTCDFDVCEECKRKCRTVGGKRQGAR
mmetsp:Transcript_102499/g.290271  ORF Transcript_102499/g.290271 Transcript_102499/m.290271 type:complete len:489 (+) Transcript_102499:61-1527(+)